MSGIGLGLAGVCDWLIARVRPELASAKIHDQDSGEGRVDPQWMRSRAPHRG